MSLHPEKISYDDLKILGNFDNEVVRQIAAWANKNLTCAHCGKCTLRCEVLKQPSLDMGRVESDFLRINKLVKEERIAETLRLVQESPDVYHALRSCCFCGFCTASCQRHMAAPDRMREWRGLFMEANLMPPQDSRMVFVDEQWNIFSAYRAIYGIAYPEFASLDYAATVPGTYDTLFFPGCSLVSYAPELTKEVATFLNACGISFALSDACCGSPLMSAGLFERGNALREGIFARMKQAGITKMITVCPGCGEEFAETFGTEIDIVPLPEVLLDYVNQLKEYRHDQSIDLPPYASYTVCDSCHDRADGRHGAAIRSLMEACAPSVQLKELDHHAKDTLCCGAGGAVGGYNDAITAKRINRVFRETKKTGADALLTMCPTCSYTVENEVFKGKQLPFAHHHYLEMFFAQSIDWHMVFSQLNGMWYGDYGPWLTQTFFS